MNPSSVVLMTLRLLQESGGITLWEANDYVGVVTLNRPKDKNAIDDKVTIGLGVMADALKAASCDGGLIQVAGCRLLRWPPQGWWSSRQCITI